MADRDVVAVMMLVVLRKVLGRWEGSMTQLMMMCRWPQGQSEKGLRLCLSCCAPSSPSLQVVAGSWKWCECAIVMLEAGMAGAILS
jgi:hypothetical protein